MTTMHQALDDLCALHCGQCSARLPRRGDPCAKCGAVPSRSRPKAAEALAAQKRAEALAGQEALGTLWADADALVHLAALETEVYAARDRVAMANRSLQAAQDRAAQTAGPDRAARSLVTDAEDALSRAEQAEETARMVKARPQSQADALVALTAARTVLDRIRGDAVAPAQEVQAAEEGVTAARAVLRRRETELAVAEAAVVDAPSSVDPSPERYAGDLALRAQTAVQLAASALLSKAEAEKRLAHATDDRDRHPGPVVLGVPARGNSAIGVIGLRPRNPWLQPWGGKGEH